MMKPMKDHKRTTYFVALALLVIGCFMTSPAAKAANPTTGSSERVSQLLSEVKAEAVALEHDAEDLAVWTRAKQMSWMSHAAKLNQMKDHVNQAGQLLTKLNEARTTASPWQQQAIDRIYPLLKELADNTSTTINHLSANKERINFSPYPDYAKANFELAQELAALISDYVEYGDHEEDFHRLQEKLQPAAS
jgi:trans-aconitate methyltransferase